MTAPHESVQIFVKTQEKCKYIPNGRSEHLPELRY